MSPYTSRPPGEGDIMLTEPKKRRKLSHEILGIALLCILISVLLFFVLRGFASLLAAYIYDMKGIVPDNIEQIVNHSYILGISAVISALFFVILFLFILGDRLVYIKEISCAVSSVNDPDVTLELPLVGSNELTELASAINEMSRRDSALRKKEKELNEEREQLVRSLSHDIRTPLTSVISYSRLLLDREKLSDDGKAYADNVYRKALQIKELTDVLLDGGRREVTEVGDIRLLCEQLLCDLEAELEDRFDIRTDIGACGKLPCKADVSEIRRIFDNLASNISKYAHREQPVSFKISTEGKELVIEQKNAVGNVDSAGHGMGLRSIRRIAAAYGGEVSVDTDGFEIIIKLPIL